MSRHVESRRRALLLWATLLASSSAAMAGVQPAATAPDFTLRSMDGPNMRLAEPGNAAPEQALR
jgi:hypothetical protein